MNELTFEALAKAMELGGLLLERKAIEQSAPIVRMLSIAGAQRGIADGVDIHGRPFAPLKHPRPEGGAGHPLRDKGLLAASLSATVTEGEIVLSANAPGARIQNYGGTIYPKKKFLAIPLTTEAKRIGSPKKNHFPRPLFFRKAAGGSGLLCENVGGKLVAQYVLVKSVAITARQYLGWSAATLDKIQAVIADKYSAGLAKLFVEGRP